MKLKTPLILLLIFLFHGSIKAQNHKLQEKHYEENSKQILKEPPVADPAKAKAANMVSKGEISKAQKESLNFIPQNKVKNLANAMPEEDFSNGELNEIANSYWRTQEEIKIAKSENNLVLLEELEANSTMHREHYISVFESLGSTEDVSAEQQTLYSSFKKDFNDE